MEDIKLNANLKFKDKENDTNLCSFKELYELVQQLMNQKDVYSTEETLTNKVWMGKSIYRKCFLNIGQSGSTFDFDTSNLNIETLVDVYGWCDAGFPIKLGSDSQSITYRWNHIIIYLNGSGGGISWLVVEYTKKN